MTKIVGYRCNNPECNSLVGRLIGEFGLCSPCYKFFRRHGRIPLKSEMRSSRKPEVIACPNCKRRPVIRKTPRMLCEVCADYYERNGKMRPRWRDTDKCINCGKPRPAGRSLWIHGRCPTCDRYYKDRNQERPERLWNKGPHGYCDCGKPATHTVTVRVMHHDETMPLCDGCYAEHMRQVRWYGSPDITTKGNIQPKRKSAHSAGDD